MPEEAWHAYEAVYCQLCRTLGRRSGSLSRLFLNYDFAFLAMISAPAEVRPSTECRRCVAHPVQGRPCCEAGEWLDRVADESVILTWWKLQDAIADGNSLQRLGARFLSVCLKGAYRRARQACPAFDREVEECLSQLSALEAEGCPSLDRTADCFARLLAAAAPSAEGVERPARQLLYHLGRWIYLIDAVDDLEEDRAAGRYDPVLARFPDWTPEDKAYLRQLLDQSLALIGAAFQLLPANAWTAAAENVIYSGLPAVEELVFSGQWREHQKKQRRHAHERSV